MGGVVAIAIRRDDGYVTAVERWTNPIPYWLSVPKMFEGDRQHWAEYMETGDPFCDKPYRYPLAPSEYGLIVFDYLTNTILDNNEYSRPNHIGYEGLFARDGEVNEDKLDRFRALAEAGRLIPYEITYPARNSIPVSKRQGHGWLAKYATEIELPRPKSVEEAIDLARMMWERDREEIRAENQAYVTAKSADEIREITNRLKELRDNRPSVDGFFLIDTSPLTYVDMGYRRDAEGLIAYRQKLLDLKFEIDDEANAIWDDLIRDYADDE